MVTIVFSLIYFHITNKHVIIILKLIYYAIEMTKKVPVKGNFLPVLSWTGKYSRERRTWSGNSLLKAGRSLSCGEQSAKLVLHPLLLTGPISSGLCFTLKVRKKKRKKNVVVQWVEQLLNRVFSGSGVHVGKHLPCWSVYLSHDLPVEAG